VEHGEVIGMLDITKFLYDAIARMEKAAEQGSAIAAAIEGVERQWKSEFAGCFYQLVFICVVSVLLLIFMTSHDALHSGLVN
jgi:hypothetical protein